MRVIVFGGSQGLGRQVVQRALADGHRVTVFSRHPKRVGVSHERLQLREGDVRNSESVLSAVKGHRVVICTLGLPIRKALPSGRSVALSAGTANIIEAMERHRSKRLILETAIGTGGSQRQISRIYRFALRVILRHLYREKDQQEALVRQSKLEWLIVRPATMTNGPATGQYLVNPPMSFGMFTHISRADAADFIVRQLTEKEYLGKAVTVTYPRAGWRDFPRWLKDFR
jgi:uncharacterized protein YbjT (DUF2867 family)